MIRHLANILTLSALLLGMASHATAQDIVANGIYYNIISDSQVEVAPAYFDGVNHYEGCIILPERVYCDGINYDVTSIAPRAFWQSAVTEVQIPNSVTMIGEAAFADAEQLVNITLPLGLTTISRYMLAGTAVTNVVVPEGVIDIGMGAFEDCTNLHTVFLPLTLQNIGERAFGYCICLDEIYSDATTPPLTMGDDAFEGCDNIHVMLANRNTTLDYEEDPVWGNEDLFSHWIDEGLAVMPAMRQEYMGENWTALTLGNSLAYKIYGPDGYLVAITAADRYFLPIGAESTDYLVVPTTLMYDEEDLQLVATKPQLTILGLDGTIYIGGDTHGLWTFIYDVYGNLWYERPAVNNWISLPGQRVYIVRVGNTVRKVFLN